MSINTNMFRELVNTRPFINQKYEKKIRILVTSKCKYSCPFCHNEGMDKTKKIDIPIEGFSNYFEFLMKISNKVVISGGEPFQFNGILKLVELLFNNNFDITISTAGTNICNYDSMYKMLTGIHISIPTLNPNNDLSNCNGNLNQKLENVRWLSKNHPLLNITINIPVINIFSTSKELKKYIDFAFETKADLKFIGYFDLEKKNNKNWYSRWNNLTSKLYKHNFKPTIVDPRQVVYESDKYQIIKITEIACIRTDKMYGNGICFDCNDITIDPNLNIYTCRWQDNGTSLSSLFSNNNIEKQLVKLVKNEAKNCPYYIKSPNLIEFKNQVGEYYFKPHGNWPDKFNSSINEVLQLLKSNHLSYFGKSGVITRLENEFASIFNSDYAMSTSSGTTALYIAYLALEFCDGAEIIVPIYSYPGTVTPLLLTGAKIKFCDVEERTGNIDIKSFKNTISDKTQGVVVTHMWGNPVNFEKLLKNCENNNIKIVEDCSHAFGGEYRGKKLGTFGDIGCFSLQANKIICAGEGGMLITNNRENYERANIVSALKDRIIDCIKSFNLKKYWETGLGLKLKINPLGAAYAISMLKNLNIFNKERCKRMNYFSDKIERINGINPPYTTNNTSKRVFYGYKPILDDNLIKKRNKIVEDLILNGLEVRIPDMRPLNKTNLFKYNYTNSKDINPFRAKENDYNNKLKLKFPQAEKYYSRIISFPSFTFEPFELIDFYSIVMEKVLKNYL